MQQESTKIKTASHHDPHSYLGVHPHPFKDGMLVLRAIYPEANSLFFLTENRQWQMEQIDPAGIFCLEILPKKLRDPLLLPYSYQFKALLEDGSAKIYNDPYRFEILLHEDDRYLFNAGTNYLLYNHLGAHLKTVSHVAGTVFRVWAPNALAVSVVGSFNHWDRRRHQMRCLGNSGIWEIFIPGIGEGSLYKYSILKCDNSVVLKTDPMQFHQELRPKTGSLVNDLGGFPWKDQDWQKEKPKNEFHKKPLAIYEVHLGSWQKITGQPHERLEYRQLAEKLVAYVIEMGFTHIELLPIMEHPLDESWGYQVTGPYAVTSRFGSPEDFQAFVNYCHENHVGVILDWVPAHFPKDGHSLGKFDGTAIYEHHDPRRGCHPDWGTYIYNYGRLETSNFLIANALFWFDVFHIDGLRVDAVASMLYLDYGRAEGEWVANEYGGKENIEAIEFLKHLNSIVHQYHPGCFMIAEESTSFFGVSHPLDRDGLGFDFKWNMGWMNDILCYFSKEPARRIQAEDKLTFPIMYAFAENFILPLSHDEVVHGKGSLLEKMPGNREQQFANLRLLLTYMWCHPGKKLLFMGAELGQVAEWDCGGFLDWDLLAKAGHRQLQSFVSQLNHFYMSEKALWELDFDPAGFRWLSFRDEHNPVLAFARLAEKRDEQLICIFNFAAKPQQDYPISLPEKGVYQLVFSSDLQYFTLRGGKKFSAHGLYVNDQNKEQNNEARIFLPPLSAVLLKKQGHQTGANP